MGLSRLTSCVRDRLGEAFLTVSDLTHLLLRKGSVFEVGHYWANVANGADAELYMSTVFAGRFHFGLRIAVGGNCLLTIFENPGIINAGVELAAYNRNRAGVGVDYLNSGIFSGPTVGVGGQNIHHSLVPGGAGIATVGGESKFDVGWVWDDTNDHVIRLTNISGGAIPLSMHMIGHV